MQLKTTFSLVLASVLAVGSCSAFAQGYSQAGVPSAKPLTPQQEKMKSCNADAKTQALAGDARKAFMKTCLSGSAAPATAAAPTAKETQQEKMKTCNADAKTKKLTGDARKTYMSTCLSGSAAH